MKYKNYSVQKCVSVKSPKGLVFVKQYVPQKSDNFSGSSMSGRKLRNSFFSWYIGLYIRNTEID
jgi:hypothetical protein